LWRIWFKGLPCDDPSRPCDGIQEGIVYQYKYYSILSNGEDLQELAIHDLPPTPDVPNGAVEMGGFEKNGVPHLLPDGSKIAYVAKDDGLYVSDYTTIQSTLIYRPTKFYSFVSVACWTKDGQSIRFIVNTMQSMGVYENMLYETKLSELNTQPIMSVSESIPFGGLCSPNGQEAVFPGIGLYILNLDNGSLQNFLLDYVVLKAQAAPNNE
jgi:hypothetical protein